MKPNGYSPFAFVARLPLVVIPDRLPVPTPNNWMLFLRRPRVQVGTLIEEMHTIAHVHEWAPQRGVDLDARFASGNGLRPDEVNVLYQRVRVKA